MHIEPLFTHHPHHGFQQEGKADMIFALYHTQDS